MCCCGASLDAGSSSVRLADLCLCADAPRAVAICVLAADGAVSWSPRQQEQEPSLRPRTGLLRALHTLLHWPLPHTQCSLPLAPGTQGGQHTALCREEKGSRARSPSAQHKSCSELALLDPIGTKDSPQQPRPARRLHQDAPPHASLAVTLHHSPGHLCTALTVPTRRSVAASRAFCPHCHLHTVLCHSVSLLPLSVPLVARCSGSVPRADVRQRILQVYISYWPLCIL